MIDGSFWEDYWAEEELEWRLNRETENEMGKQSRQIAYEADQRRMYPTGLRPPLHKDDMKKMADERRREEAQGTDSL